MKFQEGVENLEVNKNSHLIVQGFGNEYRLNCDNVVINENGKKINITPAFLRNDFTLCFDKNSLSDKVLPVCGTGGQFKKEDVKYTISVIKNRMQKELFNDSNALKRGICPKDFWDIINEEVGDELK